MSPENAAKMPTDPARRPSRVVIASVRPEVDAGRFPIKRVIGEEVEVSADIFADGHDVLSAVLLHRPESASRWTEVPMAELGNDRWQASFRVAGQGHHLYTLKAWTDPFQSWRRDLLKRVEAPQETAVDVLVGAAVIAQAASPASGPEAR